MNRIRDHTGRQYGRWTAICPTGKDIAGNILWLCRCDCGQEKVVAGTHLQRGSSRSCGCLRKEEVIKRTTIHGGKKHPLYSIWSLMLSRCLNPKDKSYARYGGRGISVCLEWRDTPLSFYSHVEGLPGYGEKDKSLDRIDNLDSYKPGNVKWSTRVEQARNTRFNKVISFNGKTQCLAAWAEEVGIGSSTIRGRLKKGWGIEEALTVKPHKGKRR